VAPKEETNVSLLSIDPTGAVFDGVGWIARYREAAMRQHALFIDAWRQKNHERALVELHFFLISICIVLSGMSLIGDALGDEIDTYVASKSYEDYRDARNHFEHIDDRLYGTGRNAPDPVYDSANPRTIHFGLVGSPPTFRFGAESIDVSDNFLAEFIGFVE